MRTTFVSKVSFNEAMYKAKMQGFRVVGQARNPNGNFIVFAEKQDNNQQGRRYSFI